MTDARVVFVPGIMGSALVDPSVPKDECQRILREGRLAKRIRAALLLLSVAVEALFRRLVCGLDPTQIWGANGMVLWALDADVWERRLTSGDGYRRSGGVHPRGLFRIALSRFVHDPYDGIRALLTAPTGTGRRRLDTLVFAYDWRLDVCGNAAALGEAIRRRWWSGGVPAHVAEDERVLIVSHSMGGLLARYYIEQLGGHRTVRHLITAGTPHRGAPLTYAILTRQFPVFGTMMEPGRPKDLIMGLGLPATAGRVTGAGDEILPAEAQFRIFRHCSSVLQLLPSTPFVRTAPGAAEPLNRSYANFRHPPTNHPALSLLNCVHDAFVPVERLPSWLIRRGLRYTFIGSDGTPTVTDAERVGGEAVRFVVTNRGDGVVPLRSAQLRPDLTGYRPFRTPTFVGIPHQTLFRDHRVLSACRERIDEHATPRPLAQATGVASIPALLQIARTFPAAKGKAVVSAVHLNLHRSNARKLLGVEIIERVVHGKTVRCLARRIPGTAAQCPVGRLDYPGLGPRDYVYVDPYEYDVKGNVGGILLLPEPDEDFVELLTWNVGQGTDLFRRETNRHHAETQFTNWFEKQDGLSHRRAVAHLLIANTTYSPCASCCSGLGAFTRTGAAAGLTEARISWTKLYRSAARPNLDTTWRSLAQLGPVWTVEPGCEMPPPVMFGPPAPPTRRVPVSTGHRPPR